ncbi:hypothetical protein IQ05_00819 [Flavobacterium tiangeerense]|uniref:Uncharacterized protein n=1 Tax=Flavobacterium tiangeerense TaxID=459471 RepID=A0ABY3FLC6_9FLAO|nr:hypothetical protein [Flavobacterium tiangeerense]TWI01246.1 hypothetical protein IQ05_00819 [Flavobacterium tiangeerense]
MKNIEQIQELFKIFTSDSASQSEVHDKGENWMIAIFKPFVRDNKCHYPFRIYGKVSGSIFPNYNENLQWYGGVNYFLDLDTNELIREEHKNNLHDAITLHINLHELQIKL